VIDSLLNFFITPAHADAMAPAGPSAASSLSLPIMLVFFIVFLYLTVWRPQSKRAKEQANLLNSITKGDEVVTVGGLVGKVTKISQTYIVLALNDSVEVTMQKSSVSTVLPKGTMKSI
jgi:preprotein translocase subunit YajC